MKNNKVKFMCLAGIFAALVFVFTAYIHISVPPGYTHIGDGFIYLAASLLPLPYAASVGAIGALLADCLTGYALWAPASVIIKALTAMFFSAKTKNIIGARNLLALIPSCALCVGGYYLYEAIITQNFIAPSLGVVGNLIQSALSSVLFVILGIAMDKFGVKKKML